MRFGPIAAPKGTTGFSLLPARTGITSQGGMKNNHHTAIVALDHITLNVRDLKTARRFYTAALGAIGMHVNMDFTTAFGMGSKKENVFWLARDKQAAGGGHYAFRVDNRQKVDAFHTAALRAGGADHGKPGPRPDYGPNYYAAFVKDPEDNNIEVVCYARARPRNRPQKRKRSR